MRKLIVSYIRTKCWYGLSPRHAWVCICIDLYIQVNVTN